MNPIIVKPIYWIALLLGICAMTVYAADTIPHLKNAKDYQRKGDDNAAIIELKNVLQEDPNNREARLLLGQSYLKLGSGDAAEKELDRARELGASLAQVLPLLGQAYVMQGKFKEVSVLSVPTTASPVTRAEILSVQGMALLAQHDAAQAKVKFSKALKLDPHLREALLGKVRVALMDMNVEGAARQLQPLLVSLPHVADVWLLQGEVQRWHRNFEAAAASFQRALDLEPNNDRAHLGKAAMLISLKEYPEAERHIDAVLRRMPQHSAALYLRGVLAYQQGHIDMAKEYLRKTLALAPTRLQSYLLLGMIQYRDGEFNQAADSLKRFMAAYPENVPARKLYAATELKLNQPDHAIETLDVAGRPGHQDPQILSLLGNAYMQKGDFSKGIDYLDQAVRVTPNAAGVRTELALGYLASGDTAEAVDELKSAVSLDPKLMQADVLLVLAHLRRNELDDALKAAQDMAQKMPTNPVPPNLMGVAYLGKKDLPRARREFEQALKLNPSFSSAHLNLARLDEMEGNQASARRHYQAILAYDDKHVGAMLNLARLAEQNNAECLHWLERAHDKVPDALAPLIAIAQYYLQRKQPLKALVAARELSDRHPNDPVALQLLGEAQMASGQPENGVASFHQLVTLAPKEPSSYYLLARAQWRTSSKEEATENTNKALALNPRFFPALLFLADIKVQGGRPQEAIAIARRLQRQRSTEMEGYELEGNLQVKVNNLVAAARAYEAAYQRGPTAPLAVKLYQVRHRLKQSNATEILAQWVQAHPKALSTALFLAGVYQNAKRNKDAIVQYESILKVQTDRNIMALALNNLAVLYDEQHDRRALDDAERAHQLRPDQVNITDTLGWLLVQHGDVRRGIALLQAAIKGAPQVGEFRYHLAVGLDKTDQSNQARKELEYLMKSNEDFPEKETARIMLARLQKKS